MQVASILFALLLLFALSPSAQAQSTKTVKETFALEPEGEVQIDTYKGSVTVTTWDRPEVELEVIIEPDEDDALVALTEIKIDHSERRLSLETDYEKVEKAKKGGGLFSWGNSTSLPFARYILRIPRTATLKIDDYKSEIQVAGLQADVGIESYKGTIDVKEVEGSLDVETYKGEAFVSDLDGALRVDTYKGDVRVAFSRLGGDSEIETYKGEVALVIPADDGFNLDADLSRRGDLETNLFNLEDLRRDPEDDDQQYQGAVAGGGPRLELETYKGHFSIRSR